MTQSSISSSLRIPSRRATLFTFAITSSWTRLKLMASSAIPKSRYNEQSAIETSELAFTPWAGTKSPKPWERAPSGQTKSPISISRLVGCENYVTKIIETDTYQSWWGWWSRSRQSPGRSNAPIWRRETLRLEYSWWPGRRKARWELVGTELSLLRMSHPLHRTKTLRHTWLVCGLGIPSVTLYGAMELELKYG